MIKKNLMKNVLPAIGLAAALVFGTSAFTASAKDRAELPDIAKVETGITAYAEAKADCMKKVFAKLTQKDSKYSKMKEDYAEYATFSEKLDGNTITITSTAKTADYESMNGTCTYKLDGDYIVSDYKTDDVMAYSMRIYIEEAVANYLGMDYALVNGYIAAVENGKIKSEYYSVNIDENAGTVSEKLYVAGAFDTSAIDSIYLEGSSLDILDALTADSRNYVCGIGRMDASITGTKDSVDIYVAEYRDGKPSELTYKSLVEIVKKLQPIGYDDFVKNYTKLSQVATDYYQVQYVTNENDIKEIFMESDSKLAVTKLTFKPVITVKSGASKKLASCGTVKTWKTSKKAVATVSKGKITALKKGTAEITATLKDGSKYTYTVKVSNSPSLTVGGKKFNKKTTYKVKKNKTLKVKITGKASSVKNVYSVKNSKIAKVTSKKTASTVKIKGLKAGTTTVTIKVNGVNYKIKVKVK